MTKGDIKIVAVSLLLVALLWAGFTAIPNAGKQSQAVVRVDGKEVGRFSLSGDTIEEVIIPVSGGDAIIQYGEGKARFSPLSRHCPDGICWRTGWIRRSGESAVCLPNHMTLSIEGGETDIDSIVR